MSVQILDEILATDSRIRGAGILDKDLKTVSSKARENLTWEKENLDHQMVALASPIILGTLSRFTDKAGKLICRGVRYDKGTFLLFKMGESFVVVSAEPGPPLHHNAETRREHPYLVLASISTLIARTFRRL